MLAVTVATVPETTNLVLDPDTTVTIGEACSVTCVIPLNERLTDSLALGVYAVLFADGVALMDGYTTDPVVDTVANTLTFELRLNQARTLATVPAAASVVDLTTHSAPADSALGVYYPAIFGAPGDGYPCVPAPMALSSGNRQCIVTDRVLTATAVLLYDTSADPVTSDYRVIDYDTDDKGKRYGYVDFDGSSITPSADAAYSVAFDPDDVATADRTALAHLIRLAQVAGWRIDWARAQQAGALRGYLLDFFVNTPTSPVDLIAQICEWVPARMLWGIDGVYPVFVPGALTEAAVIADLRAAPIVSAITRAEAVGGAYTLQYAQQGATNSYGSTVEVAAPANLRLAPAVTETCPLLQDPATANRVAIRRAGERAAPWDVWSLAVAPAVAAGLHPGYTVRTSRGLARVDSVQLGAVVATVRVSAPS